MSIVWEAAVAFLCAAAALWAWRRLFAQLAAPEDGPVRYAVVPARGDGPGLEPSVRQLRRLNDEARAGLVILIVDVGLTQAGRAAVRALRQQRDDLVVCSAQEAIERFKRSDPHGRPIP